MGNDEEREMDIGSSSKSSSIQQPPHGTFNLFADLDDFYFQMPNGWNDEEIYIFIQSCRANMEHLRNPSIDEVAKWKKIAESGGRQSRVPNLFTVNNCIEVAQCLREYVFRSLDKIVRNRSLNNFSEDNANLLLNLPRDLNPNELGLRNESRSRFSSEMNDRVKNDCGPVKSENDHKPNSDSKVKDHVKSNSCPAERENVSKQQSSQSITNGTRKGLRPRTACIKARNCISKRTATRLNSCKRKAVWDDSNRTSDFSSSRVVEKERERNEKADSSPKRITRQTIANQSVSQKVLTKYHIPFHLYDKINWQPEVLLTMLTESEIKEKTKRVKHCVNSSMSTCESGSVGNDILKQIFNPENPECDSAKMPVSDCSREERCKVVPSCSTETEDYRPNKMVKKDESPVPINSSSSTPLFNQSNKEFHNHFLRKFHDFELWEKCYFINIHHLLKNLEKKKSALLK